MTLLDYPEHVACTVFLGGCDFRCPFCHNYDLACGEVPEAMSKEELFAFLDKRGGLLDGVAITGGEPCVNSDLPDLIKEIRGRGFKVKLDTNGNHPGMLEALLSEGLVDYVSMDIKNSPEKYAATCGVSAVDMRRIYDSISVLAGSGISYEFRTTVVREFHENSDFEKIGRMIEGAPVYYLQPFTDREQVTWRGLHTPTEKELEEFAKTAKKRVPNTFLRGVDHTG